MQELPQLLGKVRSYYPDADLDLVRKAYDFAARVHGGRVRPSGEPYLEHGLAVAGVLADTHMDETTVVCGLLHDVLEEGLSTADEVRAAFGEEVAVIVDSLARVSRVTYQSKTQEQAEKFRLLILAMARDVRAVLVKLADRLHNLRHMDYAPRAEQLRIARETLDVYAPLANRLGIHRVKSELEDLGLRYSMPEVYADLVLKIRARLAERESYIEEVKAELSGLLAENGLEGRISGRPKHLFSIYRKMVDQDIPFEKVYDLVAFRVILPTVKDCYAVLGAVHARWRPVPGRFKDYISLPKPNLYQSLHTTVVGPRGHPMEVQIRTEEMHRIAEEGIAAHWRYKEKRGASPEDQVFQWLRRMVEAQQEIQDPGEFLEAVRVDLFPDVVYVFTPAEDLMELPRGATPVDFAYAVHSQVGDRCVGAKVDGRMVPLDYRLKNGDRVEIITSKHHVPSADWLEFVRTSKARTKIRHWIKTQQRARSVELGRDMCDREFRKHGKSFSKALKAGEVDAVASRFGMNKAEEVLEAVGYGKVSARQVLSRVYPDLEPVQEAEEPRRPRKTDRKPEGIVIQGVGDAMVRFARCCNPVPGDPVIGFITRGHGMTVHTANCANARRLDPQRKIEVEWGGGEGGAHPVKIRVSCDDRKGILATLTALLAQFDVNVVRADVRTWLPGQAECRFEIQVENLDRLQRILSALQGVKGVHQVQRVRT